MNTKVTLAGKVALAGVGAASLLVAARAVALDGDAGGPSTTSRSDQAQRPANATSCVVGGSGDFRVCRDDLGGKYTVAHWSRAALKHGNGCVTLRANGVRICRIR